MPLLGAHTSTAGGLHLSFERLHEIQGEALQIFTQNQRQWKSKIITDDEKELFLKYRKKFNSPPVASHASYLVNLATPDNELAEKSVAAFADELVRCETLGIEYIVIHPGAHKDAGPEQGCLNVAERLDQAFARSDTQNVVVLLENTAGSGTALGGTFEELASIIEKSNQNKRVGICYDTCHGFCAGYDIRTPKDYENTFNRLNELIGLGSLRFFHLNDSKNDFNTHKDRHEHIGKGYIGLTAFKLLLNDPRFKNHPMVLETPKDKANTHDITNLTTLRSLIE